MMLLRLTALFAILLSISFELHAKRLYADVQLTDLGTTKALWQRSEQVTPKYPVELAKEGLRGCSVLTFSLSEEGEVENLTVAESVPSSKIGRESKKLVQSWQWKTPHNVTPASEEKTVRHDFCMGGNSVEVAQQRCIRQTEYSCSQ